MSTDVRKGAISMSEQHGPKLHGTVRAVLPVEAAGQSQKQIVVIDTDEEYTQTLAVEFFGKSYDSCADKIGSLKAGIKVELGINLRGREYTKKDGSGVGYFNSISGWSVYTMNEQVATKSAAPQAPDDLPF